MQFTLITIVLSAFIYVFFKLLEKFNIDLFQTIVFNYLVCALLGFVFTGKPVGEVVDIATPALPYAYILGLSFIIVFNFIGNTSQKIGVGVASISDKLSLVLPVLFAFFAYKEEVTILKIIGILLSLVAVYFVISFDKKQRESAGKYWYFPIIVFLGGGFIGILLKEVDVHFSHINSNTFLIFPFGVAFIIGFTSLFIQIIRKKMTFSPKSMLAGFLFGIPNYGSIYFLLKSLGTGMDASIVFPILNIGIMLLSTIFGILFFRELLTKKNTIGLILSVLAILSLIIANLEKAQ